MLGIYTWKVTHILPYNVAFYNIFILLLRYFRNPHSCPSLKKSLVFFAKSWLLWDAIPVPLSPIPISGDWLDICGMSPFRGVNPKNIWWLLARSIFPFCRMSVSCTICACRCFIFYLFLYLLDIQNYKIYYYYYNEYLINLLAFLLIYL